jgi:hypothetical protein
MKLDGNTQIQISISVDMANVVLAALGSQPYERVAAIIASIQNQAAKQLIPKETVGKPEESAE